MASPMLAFRGTVTKPQLIASLRKHARADAIVQGTYWQGNGTGRGCAVGCSLHDFAPGREGVHALYPELFGIPEAIAHLEDRIFEALPEAQAKTWPLRFASAITPGADLSGVIPQFLAWLMLDETYGVAFTTQDPEVADLAAEVGLRYLAGDTTGPEATELADRLWAARDAWAARAAWAAWAARGARDAWAAWAARVLASSEVLLDLLANAPPATPEGTPSDA